MIPYYSKSVQLLPKALLKDVSGEMETAGMFDCYRPFNDCMISLVLLKFRFFPLPNC